MKKEPLVSIIVPIYNTEQYLKRCLDSILNQTHRNLEIILVDDGSTDKTPDIIKEYTKKDSRIITLHQKNQGQSTARNNGLKKATGKYISFIDSDDEVKNDFIEKLLKPYANDSSTTLSICGVNYKRLKSHTAKDVYIRHIHSRRKNESLKAYVLYLLTIDGRIYSSVNKLFLAKTAKTIEFDPKLNFAEDTKYVLTYLQKAKGTIAFVLEPLYVYNFGTETSTIKSTATDWKNWQNSYDTLKTWLGPHPSPTELFWLKTVYLRWCVSYIRSKQRSK